MTYLIPLYSGQSKDQRTGEMCYESKKGKGFFSFSNKSEPDLRSSGTLHRV